MLDGEGGEVWMDEWKFLKVILGVGEVLLGPGLIDESMGLAFLLVFRMDCACTIASELSMRNCP